MWYFSGASGGTFHTGSSKFVAPNSLMYFLPGFVLFLFASTLVIHRAITVLQYIKYPSLTATKKKDTTLHQSLFRYLKLRQRGERLGTCDPGLRGQGPAWSWICGAIFELKNCAEDIYMFFALIVSIRNK